MVVVVVVVVVAAVVPGFMLSLVVKLSLLVLWARKIGIQFYTTPKYRSLD